MKTYVNYILNKWNWGLPTGRKAYGNGSGIVVIYNNEVQKRTFSSKISAVSINGGSSLEQWQKYNKEGKCSNAYKIVGRIEQWLKYNKEGKCINAYNIVGRIEVLLASYGNIQSHPGNMTPGTDKETMDGMSYFENLSLEIQNESFTCRPTKKYFIPKKNGKLRPLGISSPRDNIIQEAMRMIFEAVLESKFSNHSHGFRPSRGCHTALAEIRYWNGVKWFIEGEIKSYLETIDHYILEAQIKEHFLDQQFIDLYWKIVRAGYVEFGIFKGYALGLPQGSIISPILLNLYLDKFDKFVMNISTQLEAHYIGKKPSMEYAKLDNTILNITKYANRYKRLGSIDIEETTGVQKKCIQLGVQQECIKLRRTVLILPPEYCRIYYVRYADDWLIGIFGPISFALELKKKISTWWDINLNLELSQEKTLITNAIKGAAYFLGVKVSRLSYISGQIKNRKNFKGHQGRIYATATLLKAPIQTLIDKYIDDNVAVYKKNAKNKKVLVGLPMTKWQLLPIYDILIRYKGVLNGILNYYSFVDNKSRLSIIYRILLYSLAKTIAMKMRLSSMRKVFWKFGKTIKISHPNNKGILLDFSCPSLDRTPKRFINSNPETALNTKPITKWAIRTSHFLNAACASCGSRNRIHMHHVRHIKTMNLNLNVFDLQMPDIYRKQVPLCEKCHNKIHSGK